MIKRSFQEMYRAKNVAPSEAVELAAKKSQGRKVSEKRNSSVAKAFGIKHSSKKQSLGTIEEETKGIDMQPMDLDDDEEESKDSSA
jgi:hypothetical protein